ncbi:hypothetical protein RGQ15_09580 [Paracoccus sp. MBLB3053]|uniref:CopG family transcriptional regulator n=1 Tax=Paracoccus aurantius TaxID=3073814 RepID=A0ABU2HS07_9RHOB|nr:hypothetical protein [Paracoccus sp. MBLB3053]MDS9467817.1 hypothetical protein [Paracoccus sp. MBLB3053]
MPRSHTIQVVVSKDEKAAFSRIACKHGTTASKFARQLITKSITEKEAAYLALRAKGESHEDAYRIVNEGPPKPPGGQS